MDVNDILLKPVITEKSLAQSANGWFTFIVAKNSTKTQIKQAVEQQFKVTVESVRTHIKKGRTKRVGKRRQEIALSPIKKALVKLAENQKIDLFEVTT